MEDIVFYFHSALAFNILLFLSWLFKTFVVKAPLGESLIILAAIYTISIASLIVGILLLHMEVF